MLRVVKKYGFVLTLITFTLSVGASAQDLGSSSSIFRSPNPKTSTPVKKTTSSKPKANTARTTRTAPPKREAAKAPAKNTGSRGKQVASNSKKGKEIKPIEIPLSTKTIINVGGPTTTTYEDFYEKAIDEGNLARDSRNYTGAENAYRRAQSLKPNESRASYGLGNIYSDQQRWEEAERAYRRAIQLEPTSPEPYTAISFVLTQPLNGVESGRYEEANKMALKAIELDPNSAVAYDLKGVSMELTGTIDINTETAYRKAIELDPNFALAYAHLGRLLNRRNSVKESTAAYKDAVRLATDVPTMILVADVLQSQQRYTESEQLLRRSLRDDPKNPTALFLLGRALMTHKAYDEAEKVLKSGIDVSPNSFVLYTQLGSLYTRTNKLDDAERVLSQALNRTSSNEKRRLSQEFELVGDGFMKNGRDHDAVRAYQRAIDLGGDKTLLTNKLNKVQKS